MKNLFYPGLVLILIALSFVYSGRTSMHDLRSLPDASGWVYTKIDDPWTVRPIGIDGETPSDAEMENIILSQSSFFSPNSFRQKMADQSQLDERAKSCDAERTGAHYEHGMVAFNVVVERLPDCSSNTGSTPIEAYLIAITGTFAAVGDVVSGRAAVERFKQMIPHRNLAGIEFRTLSASLRSSQVATDEAELNIEGFIGDSIVRIWGVGDHDDVERLLTSLETSLQNHISR